MTAKKEEAEASMNESLSSLNEQQAKNKVLYSDSSQAVSSIVMSKKRSEKVYDEVLTLIDKKIE